MADIMGDGWSRDTWTGSSATVSENANYGSDELAADATELAAKKLAADFESLTGADALNTATFTVRITCKNIKTNRVISEWLVTWTKGEVDYTVANQ